MSRIASVVHCAVLSACLLAASAAAAYTLKSAEGNFTAELQAEPRFTRLEEKASSGPYTRYQWMLDQGAVAWIVTYNDYKAGTVTGSDVTQLYNRAIWGGVDAVKGKLQSDNPVRQAGLPGRESKVFIPKGNLVMRQRIFIRGDRLYQNIYVGPAGSEDGKDVEAFFASFRLISEAGH